MRRLKDYLEGFPKLTSVPGCDWLTKTVGIADSFFYSMLSFQKETSLILSLMSCKKSVQE